VLRVEVNIPPRKGLGLSGAEAVGAVLCADRLFRLKMAKEDIANLAAQAEPSNHIDNVAASTFGGFNIVTQSAPSQPRRITTISPPNDLGVALIVPDVEKASTEATRKLLPSSVLREQYVAAIGYTSRIAWAFSKGDTEALIESLPWDPIIEPARAEAGAYGSGIDAKFLQEEKKILLDRFHVAETISGSGPSRALWYRVGRTGLIQQAIQYVSERLRSRGHRVQQIINTRPSAKGASVIVRSAHV
jgi:homoserine kinase